MIEKENLPILPKNWILLQVKDAFNDIPLTDKKVKKRDYQKEGNLPVIDQGQSLIGGYTDKLEFKVNAKSPLVIFGDHTRCFKYIDFNFVAGADGVKVLEPMKFYNPKLFFYFIQSVDFPNKGYSRHFQYLKKSYIPLPPLNEQQRIVDKIEELFTKLDDSIKDLKSVKKELEVYRKSVLNAVFKGKQTKELKEFCDDVKADIVDGPFGSNMKRSDYVTEGIPVLKIQNIKPFNIVIKKMDYIKKEKYDELKRHSFKSGDIIITKLGDPLGVSAIVPKELKRGIIVADLVRVRTNKINNSYLVYALNSPFISNYINSKQKGTTRPRVRLSIVRELPIPHVEPEEQEKIVQEIESRFSVIDKLEETVDNALIKQEQLRKIILINAFEGKLVPQDPSDEPASFLLEKIKKEKKTISNKRENKKQKIRKKINNQNIKISYDSNILYNLLKESKRPMTPESLWKLSELCIDDFYSQLKNEIKKGRIIEHRRNNGEILLEVNYEN